MKVRQFFIYKYSFPNGKIYIGQTYKGSGRYGKSQKYSGTLVGNAMAKYPDYKKEILEYCDKKNADERERFYISFFDSTDRKKGYNRDFGGNLHKEFSDELKEELSKAHIDLQVTKIEQYSKDEQFIKEWNSIKEAATHLKIERTSISKALHGVAKTAGGFVWKLKEKYNPLIKKPIEQFDLDGLYIQTWPNVIEAEKALNIHNISKALRGVNKTAGGFQWKYIDSSKNISKYQTKRIYSGKHVQQLDLSGALIKEWGSYYEAAKALNIPHQHIRRVLEGERKTTGGFKWSYKK